MRAKIITIMSFAFLVSSLRAEPMPEDSTKQNHETRASGRDPHKDAPPLQPAPAAASGPLAKTAGDAERYVGVIPTTPAALNQCPVGNRVTIYMDDEDGTIDRNGSHMYNRWGGYPAPTGLEDGNAENTGITFCKVRGTPLKPMKNGSESDFVVLRLDGACPVGGLPFSFYLDNEDGSNRNSNTGNIYPNTQSSSGTRWEFCFFPGTSTGAAAMPSLDYVGGNYAFFAKDNSPTYVLPSTLEIDNEENSNNNGVDWKGLSADYQGRIQKFMNNNLISTWKVMRKLGAE